MGIEGTLVGREREYARLCELVTRDDTHLVTVTGLPGVGKTRLVRAILDTLPDGLFVPMAAAGGRQTIDHAIVTSLRARYPRALIPVPALWESFHGRRTVVVLDDVDDSDDLAATATHLLAGYPSLVLLLTAARPTRIQGERVLALRPLPIPQADADEHQPTVALFVRRAAESGVTLDMSDAQVRTDVIAVCRQTGGLPLAVELAAARTVSEPLRFIERTFLHRQDARENRRISLRESLRAALSGVSDAARLTFAQAAQFAEPFALDAAGAVIDLPQPDDHVLDALTELVDASLLEFCTDSDRAPRFAMREPLRALALDQLDTDALDALKRRHAQYFRDRCRAGSDIASHEWPDIAKALEFCVRAGIVDDPLIAAAIASPALRRLAGIGTEPRHVTDGPDDHRPFATDLAERTRAAVWSTDLFPSDADDLTSVGLWTARRLAEATSLARESGDSRALLEALEALIRSLNITLDVPTAVAAVHEGLQLAQALDDQRAIARFEAWGAMEAQMRGNVPETVRLAAAALNRGRAHDEPIAIIWASRMLLLAPTSMRPASDPPVPDLPMLLEMSERAAQPYVGMILLGDLAREELARGDVVAAAGWAWRQLMVAADRIYSEPLSTAFAVATTVSIALLAGDLDAAVRMRESVRPIEFLFPSHMPPRLAMGYADECARLEHSMPEHRYRRLAADTAGSSLAEANRSAQRWAEGKVRRDEPTGAEPCAAEASLTAREREVLAHLASGGTNRDIATVLGVSPKTVMHHSVSIYRKIGVRGRAEVAAWAVRTGLLDDDG